MIKAYRHLIKYALERNCTISVHNGEYWEVKRSTSPKAIEEACKSGEEGSMRIRQGDDIVGWAYVIDAIDFEPEETVVDHTLTPFMEAWSEAYDALQYN